MVRYHFETEASQSDAIRTAGQITNGKEKMLSNWENSLKNQNEISLQNQPDRQTKWVLSF